MVKLYINHMVANHIELHVCILRTTEHRSPHLNWEIIIFHNLISLQPPRSTCSSTVVTLSRPPTISSLKITDHSMRYASPHLWNPLPDSFRQPHQSCLDSPPHPLVNPSLASSPLSSSITPSLFQCRLKTYLLNKSFSP